MARNKWYVRRECGRDVLLGHRRRDRLLSLARKLPAEHVGGGFSKVTVRIPDEFLRWMDEAVACCMLCGREIARGEVMCGRSCRIYHFDVETFFCETHMCPYNPEADGWSVDFLPRMELESVSEDGRAKRVATDEIDNLVVDEFPFQDFQYWKGDFFAGTLKAMCFAKVST